MKKNMINDEAIRDAHLDTLIRLAYERAELEENQKLVEDNGDSLPEELAAMQFRTYATFEHKRKRKAREKQRAERAAKAKNHMPKIVNIAAVVMIALCVIAPFAVARVDFLRDKMMEMLICFEDKYADISLEMEKKNVCEVPEGWTGSYYPTYIPEGYWVEKMGTDLNWVVLKNKEGDEICFYECAEQAYFNVDNENSVGTALEIGGKKGYVTEKNDKIIIIWNNGDRYFILHTNEPKEVAICIAEQIRLIKNKI